MIPMEFVCSTSEGAKYLSWLHVRSSRSKMNSARAGKMDIRVGPILWIRPTHD